MHASETAQVMRDVLDSPPPGSLEEQEALQEIDRRRIEETNPIGRRARIRRARAHWSDREHALGG